MEKIRQYGIILTVSVALLACKKDTTIILGDGETPAQDMSKAVPYVDNVEDSYSFEIGFVFVSAKNGRVTQLGGRLAQQGVSKVSIWDFDTQQKLDSIDVLIKDIAKFAYLPITPIAVVAGKKYLVSINTFPQRDYYVFNSLGDYDILPRTFGNITILEKRSNESGDFSFPGRPTLKNFNGWADIVFVADKNATKRIVYTRIGVFYCRNPYFRHTKPTTNDLCSFVDRGFNIDDDIYYRLDTKVPPKTHSGTEVPA